MEQFESFVSAIRAFVWEFGIPVGGNDIPLVVIALIGTGLFLTLRLGFVQITRFGHGLADNVIYLLAVFRGYRHSETSAIEEIVIVRVILLSSLLRCVFCR